jgi:tetratricopeptide (TPR) repeat protein
MAALELIFAALLFILSSGILFNERFRKNPFLIAIAAIFAIGSTLSLIGSFRPQLFKLVSTQTVNPSPEPARQPPSVSQEPAPAKAKPISAPQGQEFVPLKPTDAIATPSAGPDCDWSKDETVDDCIAQLRQSHSVQDATGLAFRGRGLKYLQSGDFELADQDLSVALQNEKDADSDPVYVMRGYARLRQKKYQLALDDCDRFNTPQKLAALQLLGLLFGGGKSGDLRGMVYDCRGIALSNLGRHQEAVDALNLAISAGMSDWETYDARATSRLALGDKDGAESDRHISNSMIVDGLVKLFVPAQKKTGSSAPAAGP